MSDVNHKDVAGADKHAARKSVLETSELIELILTFLPAKNVFGVLRVFKYRNNVITNSVSLQHKMFLRLSDKPHELWTVDVHHEPGANYYARRSKHLNDIAFKLRRINLFQNTDMPIVKPLTLNPTLRDNSPCDDNALIVHVRRYSLSSSNSSVVYLRYSGWVNPFRHDESLGKTYLTDPGCHEADVAHLTLYLGEHHAFPGWIPVEVPVNADDIDPGGMLWNTAPIKCEVKFLGGDVRVRSDKALTMGDMLRAAFNTPSHNWHTRPKTADEGRGAKTVYDTLDLLQRQMGAEVAPKRLYMVMYMRIWGQADSQIILPTNKERAQANAEWKPLQRQ